MARNSNWIAREEIAEIYDSLAQHHPAKTETEQRQQKKYSETAKLIRETDLLGNPMGSRTAA